MSLTNFLRESLKIEGIHRDPTPKEIEATEGFLAAESMTVVRVKALVAVYAPHARLRDKAGLNVRVGNHVPLPGGAEIKERLQHFLDGVNENLWTPFEAHRVFETLHPFTDGNGCSGRAIWLWQMRRVSSRDADWFLREWYYQSLQEAR